MKQKTEKSNLVRKILLIDELNQVFEDLTTVPLYGAYKNSNTKIIDIKGIAKYRKLIKELLQEGIPINVDEYNKVIVEIYKTI